MSSTPTWASATSPEKPTRCPLGCYSDLVEQKDVFYYRAFHLKELSNLFVQVVRLAREMGLFKRKRSTTSP